MVWIFVFLLSLISFTVFVDVPTMLFLLFIYFIGICICFVVGAKERIRIAKLYHTSFSMGSIFMLMTYVYMTVNNYNLLLSYDSFYYFLPTTERYLTEGNYWNVLQAIWEDYDFFNRFQSGYFSYATLLGYLSNAFKANFFLGQQISVLFLFSFVSVVIYKLFRVNKFSTKKAYKYTLIICFFSILFFYSSQILRDVHVLLLYLLGIYFTFKKEFSIINLFKIAVVIFLCTTIRLESGLFLFILIPVYLFLSIQKSKQKIIATVSTAILSIIIIASSMTFLSQIVDITETNQEIYMDDKGSGITGTLQKFPLVGNIASIIYNAAQPIPFWSRFLTKSIDVDDQAVFNIMNFPRSFASFFNWMVIVYIAFWLFSKKIRKRTSGFISKPLLFQLWIGFFFLMLQSAVVSQRRLLAYYCIYYILFFIIYNCINRDFKKQINMVVVLTFVILQIVGFLFIV